MRLAGTEHKRALLVSVVGPLLRGVIAGEVVHRHAAVDAVKALDRDTGAPAVLIHHELRLEEAEIAGAEVVVQHRQPGLLAGDAKAKRDDLPAEAEHALRVGQAEAQHLVALDVLVGHELNLLRQPTHRAVTEHPAIPVKPKTCIQQARRTDERLRQTGPSREVPVAPFHQVKVCCGVRNRAVIRYRAEIGGINVEAQVAHRLPYCHLVHVYEIEVVRDVRVGEIGGRATLRNALGLGRDISLERDQRGAQRAVLPLDRNAADRVPLIRRVGRFRELDVAGAPSLAARELGHVGA